MKNVTTILSGQSFLRSISAHSTNDKAEEKPPGEILLAKFAVSILLCQGIIPQIYCKQKCQPHPSVKNSPKEKVPF
jgi:hypothetical protein